MENVFASSIGEAAKLGEKFESRVVDRTVRRVLYHFIRVDDGTLERLFDIRRRYYGSDTLEFGQVRESCKKSGVHRRGKFKF